jgi:site-specific DNA-methyltransferase (adenine-specific)
MLELNTIYLMDCMEGMKQIPDKSVDLIVTDPPYNIGKAKWDKINNYIEWCGAWLIECQRVLKDNGSLYFWHNDMIQIVRLMEWVCNNTRFVFKQFIVWNKRFMAAKNKGYLDGYIMVDGLRNYQQMAEYCLFYTFQDETGLTTVMLDTNNFPTLRGYFKEFQDALGLTKKQIIDLVGQQADHCFRWGSSQWDMPTPDTYVALCKLPLKYEFVRREYEDLRREYEDLRYTFNNQKTHHSVWEYEIAERNGHITPKPVPMFENIIQHSSKPGDTVLDCFLGSGTTAIACINTGRNFIGIENDASIYAAAVKRIEEHKAQIRMEL